MTAPGPRSWLDAITDHSLVGWVSLPAAAGSPQVLLNGEVVTAALDAHGRPDVVAAGGLVGPVYAFEVPVDVVGLPVDSRVVMEVVHGAARCTVVAESVAEMLLAMVARRWDQTAATPAWHHFVGNGLACGKPPSGMRSGAGPLTGVDEMADGERRIAGRPDLTVSRFQQFAHHRYSRDHPGLQSDRYMKVSTRTQLRAFLLESLRRFSRANAFAPLPVGSNDLVWLNGLREGSGLAKGRTDGLSFRAINLTSAQADFVLSQHGRAEAESETELCDWLLSWLTSWGWGHRGRVLLSQDQTQLLARTRAGTDAGSVGELTQLNGFAAARCREAGTAPAPQSPVDRLRLLLELAADEAVHVGSLHFISASLKRFLTDHREALGADPETPRLNEDSKTIAMRVIGMTPSRSGLGHSARQSVSALHRAGISADVMPLAINDSTAGSSRGSASRTPARINLWHINPDNLPDAFQVVDAAMHQKAYNIGFFAWELGVQPRSHELAIDLVDEVWTPSEFCARSFRSITDKPVVVMPHAVEVPEGLPDMRREDVGLPRDAFVVYYGFDMFSWPQRKNPLGVLETFQRACVDESSRLLLRIRNASFIGALDSDREGIGEAVLEMAQDDERILVDTSERTYAESLAFHRLADCHLSLHRSEGFGYGLAEALALGVPLVCSDYSGSRDFCNDENSWLVPVTERELKPGDYFLDPPGALWAEPDVGVAVEHLAAVRAGGSVVEARRQRGVVDARDALSLDLLSKRYASRLAALAARQDP